MTPEVKNNNKNYILNNLDKYVIDSRENFYGNDVDIEYSYISKSALPEGVFELLRDRICQKILAEASVWEITDYNSESWHVVSTPVYRHKTTGMTNHSAGFTWEQKKKLEAALSRRNENNRPTDNPAPAPLSPDNEDNTVNRRRQNAIDEIAEQFAISNITIDEIEKLARNHVSIESIGREQGIWPLSEWKSKINRMRTTLEVSQFSISLRGFIHATANCRDEGVYARTSGTLNNYKEIFNSDDWYKNWQKDNGDYLRKITEDSENAWRDLDRRSHEEQRRSGGQDDWKADYLRKKKAQAIDEIEERLVEKKVSEDELNKKLGKSDWREEINKFSDYGSERILSKQFFLEREIDKLSRKFACAGCGRTRDDIYSPHEEDGKQFCINFNCWEKYRKQNDNNDPSRYNDNSQKDKEFKELKNEVAKLREWLEQKLGGRGETVKKSYNRMTGETTVVKKNPLGELLEWMKQEGITNIRLDPHSKQLVIEFGSHNSKTLKDNELSAEQKELKNFFMQNPTKQSFNRAELEKLGGEITGQKPKSDNNDKMVTGLIVAGVILLVVTMIGVAVYKSRKKDY